MWLSCNQIWLSYKPLNFIIRFGAEIAKSVAGPDKSGHVMD